MIAPSTAIWVSSSFPDSAATTNGVRTWVSFLVNADPATVTSDASAFALNADIGCVVRVGIKTGKTVDARTWETSGCQRGSDSETG